MKKLYVILMTICFSINIYSQDTIRLIDGTIIIEDKLDTNANFLIIDKIGHLEFSDLKNQLVVFDTTNNKPFVINIWATWCHPCVAEIPTLNNLMEKYKNCNVNFYALSYTEDMLTTKKFIKSNPFNFKQIFASNKYIETNKLSNGLPTTLFIDKNGRIVYWMSGGSVDSEKQEETISKFIKGMEKIGCP